MGKVDGPRKCPTPLKQLALPHTIILTNKEIQARLGGRPRLYSLYINVSFYPREKTTRAASLLTERDGQEREN
jgi:hypothetical protein